jgi:crotonobetainyl-CoA:carnitine CoA-transferase CaiB-like acyl-CoA transferase
MTRRPLEGIRVLDLTRVFSGPWCTQMLGDLGAEVIKVEQPRRGDDLRKLGPPFLKDGEGKDTKESAYYLSVNRNKKSINVDISTPQGQDLIRALALKSDVMIENFKVGNLARYGLDYETLSKDNVGLVYCSITAFGQTGPYRHRLGYDTLLQAMCGVMSVTGHADGMPGGGPIKVGFVLSDLLAGSYAATAILSALYARDAKAGRGQHIDISMFDTQLAAMSHQAMHYLVAGENPQRYGTGAPSVVPSQVFPCSDGHIVLVAGNDDQFRRLCKLIGLPDLGVDPLYATNGARVRNRLTLIPQLEARFVQRGKAEWLAALEAEGLVAGPINTLSDVFAEPQVEARELVAHGTHALGGDVPMIVSPMRMSGTPLNVYEPPPYQGQHTRAVLSGTLGLSDAEITRLEEARIIAD